METVFCAESSALVVTKRRRTGYLRLGSIVPAAVASDEASAVEASDADKSPASAASAVADLTDACRAADMAGVPDGRTRSTVRLEPFQEEMAISEERRLEPFQEEEEMAISEEGRAYEETMVEAEDKMMVAEGQEELVAAEAEMMVAEADNAHPEPATTSTAKVEEVPGSSTVEEAPGPSAGDGDSVADEVLLVSLHVDEEDDETTLAESGEAPAAVPATAKTMAVPQPTRAAEPLAAAEAAEAEAAEAAEAEAAEEEERPRRRSPPRQAPTASRAPSWAVPSARAARRRPTYTRAAPSLADRWLEHTPACGMDVEGTLR